MSRTALAALSAFALLACAPGRISENGKAVELKVEAPAPAPKSAPAVAHVATAPELFGAPFAADVPAVSLGALISDPAPYNGQIIETTGKVSQVCQAAGCWMELSDAGSGERVRTPMAGHAFFLPK